MKYIICAIFAIGIAQMFVGMLGGLDWHKEEDDE